MKTRYIAIISGTVIVITVILVCLMQKASYTSRPKPEAKQDKQILASGSRHNTSVSVQKPNADQKPSTQSGVKRFGSHIKRRTWKPGLFNTATLIPQTTLPVALQQSRLFNTNYLELQEFNLPYNQDTTITAKEGMKVSIPAHAFVTQSGKTLTTRIKLEVKEAFTPEDIVLANLVTKKGKQLLESGGMFYIQAIANGEELVVANDKKLTIEVPTPSKEEGMELYKGLPTDGGIDWTEPKALNEEEIAFKQKPKAKSVCWNNNSEAENVVKGDNPNVKDGDRNFRELKNGKIDKMVVKRDSLGWFAAFNKTEGFITCGGTGPSTGNHFAEDGQLRYLMQTNRMGWANIDRLANDPRSRQIKFTTVVEDNKNYQSVYISMIFQSKRMYLPGYQKMDGTYSFTHGDYEAPVLPVGETAFIVVSALKDNQRYFTMKQIKISDNLSVSLALKPATEDEIKAEVNKSL